MMGIYDYSCLCVHTGDWFPDQWQISKSCSVTQLCLTICNPMDCSTPGFLVLCHLPELAQTQVHWVGDAIQPSHPLSFPSPSPAFNLSQHEGLYQWVSSSHQVAKVLDIQLQHQSSQGMFRIDFLWIDRLDLLAVQGTFKSFFSNTTVQKHQFFGAQPSLWSNSHPYTPNGKAIALTRWTSVGKVMCLLFNTLSRFVIAFLSKKQVSFNFMAAFTICSDFGAHENKDRHCFHCFPIYLPWSDGTRCHDLSFLNAEF